MQGVSAHTTGPLPVDALELASLLEDASDELDALVVLPAPPAPPAPPTPVVDAASALLDESPALDEEASPELAVSLELEDALAFVVVEDVDDAPPPDEEPVTL